MINQVLRDINVNVKTEEEDFFRFQTEDFSIVVHGDYINQFVNYINCDIEANVVMINDWLDFKNYLIMKKRDIKIEKLGI